MTGHGQNVLNRPCVRQNARKGTIVRNPNGVSLGLLSDVPSEHTFVPRFALSLTLLSDRPGVRSASSSSGPSLKNIPRATCLRAFHNLYPLHAAYKSLYSPQSALAPKNFLPPLTAINSSSQCVMRNTTYGICRGFCIQMLYQRGLTRRLFEGRLLGN